MYKASHIKYDIFTTFERGKWSILGLKVKWILAWPLVEALAGLCLDSTKIILATLPWCGVFKQVLIRKMFKYMFQMIQFVARVNATLIFLIL
jgi:hypothetical protein